MKLKSWHLALFIFVIVFGGIGLTSLLNLWQTESSRTPEKFVEGESAGDYDPAEIRGSFSFGDISSLFDIPLEDLARAFDLPQEVDAAAFQNKDLESVFGVLEEEGEGFEIGNSSVQLFVAYYSGLPFEIEDEIYLPEPAAAVLKEKADLSQEQLDYLDQYTIPAEYWQEVNPVTQETQEEPAEAVEESSETEVPQVEVQEEEEHDSDTTIKGSTTFREVMDWGVPEEEIEALIGSKLPNPLTIIKDYCLEQGLGYGEIKLELQARVDAAQE